jgi:hypothetical protein
MPAPFAPKPIHLKFVHLQPVFFGRRKRRRAIFSIDRGRDDPEQIDSFLALAPEAVEPGRFERKRVAWPDHMHDAIEFERERA